MAADIFWCKITQSGVLQFEGADALSFLQGQLTNNVAALDAVHSQYAGYCSPKGRLLAAMLLWQHDSAYRMLLPRELCEPIRKRLSMYILRAKVKSSDLSPQLALYGLGGEGAAALAVVIAGAVPAAVHEVVHGDNVTVLKLPQARYLLVATMPAAGAVESKLAAAAASNSETLWTGLDIAAGIANVYPATQEQFVPQAVNFDLIAALSFDKGCYPGQEIVARTHYLGRVKQRMVRAQLQTHSMPAPGDKLYSPSYPDQASGMIVSAAVSDSDKRDVLAVVQCADIGKGGVHWQTPDGPELQIVPLPYPVT